MHKGQINTFVEEEIVSRAVYGGMQASYTIETFLRNNDVHSAEQTLSWFGEDPDLNLALLVDTNNIVILSTRYELKGKPLPDIQSSMMANLTENAIHLLSKQYRFSDDRLTCIFVFPVSFGAKPGEIRPLKEGVLCLEYGLARAKKAGYVGAIKEFYQFAAVLGIMCLLLWGFFEWVLTRRIKRLVVATQDLMIKNYDVQVNLGGKDELANLGKSFDVMARKIRENTIALGKSEVKYRNLFENANDAIYIVDSGTLKIIDGNKKACDVYGYTVDEFRKKTLFDLHTKDDHERILKFQKLIETNRSISDISGMYQKRKDGSFLPVELSMSLIEIENLPVYMCIVRDITERKKMEDQLFKLSQAIEQSTVSVVITDLCGKIQYANPMFTRITGYTREEALGQNPRILKSGRTTNDEYQHLWDTITAGKSWQGEFYNKKKNGECYWELAQIMPMRNTEGKIINFLAFKEDITERKLAEEKQGALREQLYHSQKIDSIGRLAGGIAHDFNNILTAIIGYASLMSMGAGKNISMEDCGRKIVASAEKAAKLTQGLLAYSRKQVIHLKPVDLNTIIKKAELLTERIIREDIKYTLLLAEKDLIVMADSGQIEQVLVNLVANARDAMPDGGVLTIRTGMEIFKDKYIGQLRGIANAGNYAFFLVSDTGTGMDEETQKRIFEPFYTTKEVNKGTGLGLSIVYGIVKQHKGYIDVRSKPGEGSEFIVYLPLVDAVAEETETKTEKAPVKGTETILLAEDDENVRDFIGKTLEIYGYKVIAAVDGEDATNKFMNNSKNIDMLIFDVRMPKKNGKDAYHLIEKMKREIKTIFLSGYAEDSFPQSILRGNHVSFIQKPISPEKLLKKIRAMLDS